MKDAGVEEPSAIGFGLHQTSAVIGGVNLYYPCLLLFII